MPLEPFPRLLALPTFARVLALAIVLASFGAEAQSTATSPAAAGKSVTEGERGSTPQQLRHYRSYGQFPEQADPRTNRPRAGSTRTPAGADVVGSQRPSPQSPATARPATGNQLFPVAKSEQELALEECASRYPNFNPKTGNYMLANGHVRRCHLLGEQQGLLPRPTASKAAQPK